MPTMIWDFLSLLMCEETFTIAIEHICNYTPLSSSRLRLSQSEHLARVLTWKSNNRLQNIVKGGEIAPKEQFLLLNISITFGVKIHIHL